MAGHSNFKNELMEATNIKSHLPFSLFILYRFDWEDKLLEKTIKTDIKLDQHMTNLEETVDEIRAHKAAFEEWKSNAAAQYDEMKNAVNEKVEELQEWKRQASQLIAHASKLQKATYTRWGRTTCRGNGSESLYDGFAGGSHYQHKGGASSMLCLPKDPDWEAGKTSDKTDPSVGLIYGVSYEDSSGRSDQLFGESHDDRHVPCVVCDVKERSSVLMIPGKSKCHPGWTIEYVGYLMAGNYDHDGATDYYCIDKDPENVPDMKDNDNGHLLYFVEARCGSSLRCPPYVNGRELMCAVCTK